MHINKHVDTDKDTSRETRRYKEIKTKAPIQSDRDRIETVREY